MPALSPKLTAPEAPRTFVMGDADGSMGRMLLHAMASGVATRYMARTEAAVVGSLGAGKQAIGQLEAVCAVRTIREARVWSRNPERAKKFCAALEKKLGVTMKVIESAEEAVRGADIINVITKSGGNEITSDVFAYTEGFTAKDDPAKDGFPRMPEECYAIQLGEGNPYPKDRCLYPVLRELGVSEDAIRYYDETNGTMVLGLAGDGPVKVAHMWWGPFGSNDYPEAQILTPLGFMMATPVEWAPYAAAQEEATRSDVLPRIIAATGEGTPYGFVPVYPWQIHEPVATATGWSIATTSQISGSCHACGVEFAGRFVLEFALDGTPTGARFDGFCAFASEALEGNGQRVEGADADAIAALKAELPVCEPAHWGESVIDWPALKAAQG